jgi:hypothetical protein
MMMMVVLLFFITRVFYEKMAACYFCAVARSTPPQRGSANKTHQE